MPLFQKLTITILMSLVCTFGYAQDSFQIGFWNVENLFDTTNSARINDEAFTPQGRYAWTEERLAKKLEDLTKVIREMNQSGDLDILGLAEIENKAVLTRLNEDYLKAGYSIVHRESPDERGIDCALLYDSKKLGLYSQTYIPVYLAGDEKTRDILEAQFIPVNDYFGKTLYVFVNHWPSRYGGVTKTDPLRRSAAQALRDRIDIILRGDPNADIVVLGDFNDYPDNHSLRIILRAAPTGAKAYPGDLINTTWPIFQDPKAGTVMYRGDWVVLDQIIISAGMQNIDGYSWQPLSTHTFQPDYLLESSGKYVGWPFRMYRGSDYQGGYSDHLPVLGTINYK